MTDFKTKMAELAAKYNISHKRDIDWHNFVAEVEELTEAEGAEWSEADETYLQDALWCVDKAEQSCKDEEDKGACWSAKRWLKSLRPVIKESLQSWKPSEEQMEALEYVIRDYREDSCNATANYLQEILDNLKNM